SAYVRRNPLTYVCAGSSSNCSSSSARRYLPRIFVASSAWAKSILRRTRASRRLLPISNTRGKRSRVPAGRLLGPAEHAVHRERERARHAGVHPRPGRDAREPERPAAPGDAANGVVAGTPGGREREQPERGGDRHRHVERLEEPEPRARLGGHDPDRNG